MSITGDVWTAYCESSSGGKVDSFFLLANLAHCYESFSVFRQTSYPSNISMVFPWIIKKHCLEGWAILDVNNFLSKQNYYFVSLQVMQSPIIAIIVISICDPPWENGH